MQRLSSAPRQDWQTIVESQGMHYHTLEDQPYWDESAYYAFTSAEIDSIEKATYDLNDMCLKAVDHVIERRSFAQFGIPAQFVDLVIRSWEHDEQTIYGRFDFSYDGVEPPKLLEYNADTPTALLEASVIQWFWLKQTRPEADQFNSIHERLIEAWKLLKEQGVNRIHFASLRGNLEDYMTVNYLRDTAMQGGLQTEFLHVEDIGWNQRQGAFVDLHEQPIATLFKLYPWEWMLKDQFGPHLLTCRTRWLEPPWKMILSNKAILAVLWELFPESPYLLQAAFEPVGSTYIKKPLQGREGCNVTLVFDGAPVMETEGTYGEGPWIYQEVRPLPKYDGNYPVIGSWLVNGYACGMGIREDNQPITQNTSRFVPHVSKSENRNPKSEK
jgi:glutathionylspermidine synthase